MPDRAQDHIARALLMTYAAITRAGDPLLLFIKHTEDPYCRETSSFDHKTMAPPDDGYKFSDNILETVIKLQTAIREFDLDSYQTLDAQRGFRYLLSRLTTEIKTSIIEWEMGVVSEDGGLTPESKLIRNIDHSLGIFEARELPHPTVEEDTKEDDSPPRTAVTKMSAEEKSRASNLPSDPEETERRIEEEAQLQDSQDTEDENGNRNGFYASEPSSANTKHMD